MDWSTVWELISRFWPTVASGLVIKSGQWAWRRLHKRWRLRRALPSAKRDEPRQRRRPRRSAYRVSDLSRLDPSQGLEHYIAARGLVPLEARSHQRGLRAAQHAVLDFLFTTRTIAKPGFRVLGWHCHPVPGSAPIVGSFVLAIRLHPNENRRHLEASLRSHTALAGRPRLVAIASILDLFDDASLVRCYAVDALLTNLDDDDVEMIGVQSCDGVHHGVPTCSTSTVVEVPDDAVWLITDNPAHTSPNENWGSSPADVFETQDDPRVPQPDAETLRELDDDYAFIHRALRRTIIGKAIIWLTSGPGLVLASTALLSLAGALEHVAVTILAIWLTIWLIVFTLYLGLPVAVLVQTWWWRRRDNQRRDGERAWRGGTTDGLIFGVMVRRGRVLNKTDWKRFWLKLRPEE